MPFGLTNAPSTFQRLMSTVLAGLSWVTCLVYLDDIIIFSRTVEEHLQRLTEVLQGLKEAVLKIKPSKCHLLCKSVRYLGYVVSEKGIAADADKIKCVENWPTLTDHACMKACDSSWGLLPIIGNSFAILQTPLLLFMH